MRRGASAVSASIMTPIRNGDRAARTPAGQINAIVVILSLSLSLPPPVLLFFSLVPSST